MKKSLENPNSKQTIQWIIRGLCRCSTKEEKKDETQSLLKRELEFHMSQLFSCSLLHRMKNSTCSKLLLFKSEKIEIDHETH